MTLPQEGKLLRIFVGEGNLYRGKAVYEQVVLKARDLGLAGATVTRGIMGFGADSRMHTAKLLRLSEELPVIIEIVDTEEKVNLLLPFLDEVVKDGLITTENVKVIRYQPRATK